MSQAAALRTARAERIPRAAGRVALGSLVGLTYFWWSLVVLEWDRYLATVIGGPWYRIPALLAPLLAVWVLRVGDARRAIYWPTAFFTLLHLLALGYAENRGFTLVPAKFLLYMILTTALVLTIADVPSRLVTLFKIYAVSFIWFGIQGIPSGRVWWHYQLNNEDSYGPLMCIAFGFSYYFALACRSRAWRLVGYVAAGIGCIGVVASFARGAVLSFGATLLTLWLRSPRKFRTLISGLVLAGVTLVAIETLFPGGAFWAEMQTVTSEGKDEGTGMVRWVMWGLALELWQDHPILGIGASNFGIVAAQTFSDDQDLLRKAYGSASQLWGQQLHNSYIQVLCEEGLVGILVFLGITVGFFRRVWRLRSDAVQAEWRRRGGEVDVRFLALALELGMIGFLCNGFFYNQMYVHWYWTLLALSLALERCTERQPDAARAPAARRAEAPRRSEAPVAAPAPAPASLGTALLGRGRTEDPRSGA
jgi:O-antigen ligase